jgi:hypothetical protein
MRLLLLILLLLPGVAAAQPYLTPGLSVAHVIQYPSDADVGPYLAPLGYGGDKRGKAASHMRARPGRTTTDLVILTNQTGYNLIVSLDYTTPNPDALRLRGWRRHDAPLEEEVAGHPSSSAQVTIVGVDMAAASVPNEASVAIFVIQTKWGSGLRHGARYLLSFDFECLATTEIMAFEAELRVDKKEDDDGCRLRPGTPAPMGLLAAMGGAALVSRRVLARRMAV